MNLFKLPRLIIYTSLGFLLFFTSCKTSIPNVSSSKIVYFEEQIEVPSSTLVLSIKMSYDSILGKLNYKNGKTLVDIREESGSDPLLIQLANTPKIVKQNNRFFITNCLLNFRTKPSIAGINAGWIEGKIKMDLQLDVNKLATNQFNFSSCAYQYEWIEKPQVKMMGFSVNVASILDKYIQSREEKLREAFLLKINPIVDPSYWMPLVRKQLIVSSIGNYQLLSNQIGIEFKNFTLNENDLSLNLKLDGLLGFKWKSDQNSSLHLIGKEDNLFYFFADKSAIQLMFDELVQKNESIHSKSVHINSFSPAGMNLEASGMFGSKSKVKFDCQLYSSDSKLKFSATSIRLEKIKFPYSLFKNSIKNKLINSIGSMSIDIHDMLIKGDSNAVFRDITFKEIRMNSASLVLVGKYNGPILQINP